VLVVMAVVCYLLSRNAVEELDFINDVCVARSMIRAQLKKEKGGGWIASGKWHCRARRYLIGNMK
jgi:hypothetical protein